MTGVTALDLGQLRTMHPLLSVTTAREYTYRAAIGLERNQHSPGVGLAVHLDGRRRDCSLHWPIVGGAGVAQLDVLRVTEDAAEAIALTVVYVAYGWTVLRRMQRSESGDWMLIDADRKRVALEVSGVDKVDTSQRRLKMKIEQVSQSRAETKMACVVELGPPRCRTRTV